MSYAKMNTCVPWSLVKNGFHKTPHFNSLPQKTMTGRRSALSMTPYPTWDFEIDLNYVNGGPAAQFSVVSWFLGCYLACCGGAGFFLFTDPGDNSVDDTGLTTPQSCMLNVTPGAAAPMAQTGDGVSTQFQLARNIDQGTDILQQVSNVTVFVNGEAAGATIGATGIVTFSTAPANGTVLTWNGAFQYLCQFTEDTLKDLAIVNKNRNGWLWSCGSIQFESVFV